MELRITKPLTEDDMFKGMSKSYSSFTGASGTDLKWYMVERDTADWSSSSDDMKNLFKSFGISREDENDWFNALGMVDDWYNAKRMIIIAMDESKVQSFIDGSTLRVNIPTGLTSGDYVTFYGSNFNGAQYNDGTNKFIASSEYDDGVYGSATAYLYANTQGTNALPSGTYPSGWNIPYSGSYDGGEHPNSGQTDSWVVNTSKRSVPHLRATHWSKATDDGQDTPYGIAFLERGLFVFFDMYGRTDFISNVASLSGTSNSVWNASTAGSFQAVTYTGGTEEDNTNNDHRKNISFTGTVSDTNASVSYRTVEQAYKMIYFCHAGQNEFNSTTNHTYNHAKAYFRPEEADSLYISEIALYDNDNSVLAYAKFSEPVEKSRLETLTFKVELEL